MDKGFTNRYSRYRYRAVNIVNHLSRLCSYGNFHCSWVRRIGNRRIPGRASRALSVAAGGLAVALSVSIMASPTFGVQLAGVVMGIALLVYGIRLFITGVSGLRHAIISASSSSDTIAT
jgi:hypothetical protein